MMSKVYFHTMANGAVQEDTGFRYMEMSALMTHCPPEVNPSPVMQEKKKLYLSSSIVLIYIPLDK